MEMSWADKDLERDCFEDRRGLRRFGADAWKLLKRRLATLLAAPTLEDMSGLPGNCHALVGDRAGEFAVSVGAARRLIFVPDDDPLPTLPDGGLDRRSITKIRVTEVVDYHDD